MVRSATSRNNPVRPLFNGDFYPSVLASSLRRLVAGDGSQFAFRARLDLLRTNAQLAQFGFGEVGALLAVGHVFGSASYVIGVAGEHDGALGISLQVLPDILQIARQGVGHGEGGGAGLEVDPLLGVP